jgi:hypothetical protein
MDSNSDLVAVFKLTAANALDEKPNKERLRIVNKTTNIFFIFHSFLI